MVKRRIRLLLLVLSCLTVATVSFTFYQVYCLFKKPLLSNASSPIDFRVEKNTSAIEFAKNLKAKKLIYSDRLLLLLIKLEGLSYSLKAGLYQIKPTESAQQFIAKVASGGVLVESISIIEGTNLAQVITTLKNASYLHYTTADWQEIQGNLPSAEGLLLADTYHYNADSSAKQLLGLANEHLQRFLQASWLARNPDLPYKSPYELLIAASIIEKESAIASERKLIAGVIANRLKKNMPLQMDPTVIYALGKDYLGKLSHEDLSVNSAYNTYRNRGLPPTPIAMVSKEAISAAAQPQITNYLYFVAKGDGSHYFSETYEKQKATILQLKKEGTN